MKIIIKRAIAYIVDLVLVSVIATFITSNSYINKDYNKYIKTYEEYEEYYEKYEKNVESLEKKLDEDKITKKEYKKGLEKINESYDKKNKDYNYKLIKLSTIPTIINILLILLYFVVIQYYMAGVTLGKKIMKLRVVSNNHKKINIFNYLLRSLILNGVFINLISVFCTLILSKHNYLIFNQISYIANYFIEMTIVFLMMFDKNNRGLQDYVANTKVIYEGVKHEVQ